MAGIKEALRDFNPWWEREFRTGFKDREIYKQIQKFMPLPQIMALTGLRRVGKTTLMLKIVEDAIRKIDRRNIIYFSFDEFKEVRIRDIMKEYQEMTGKDFREVKCLILLDEVQKLTDWEEQLKTIYDTFGKNIKIIISGSESLFIRKKSKETLAGRIFEFKVELLSFKEFLSFKGADFEPIGLHEDRLLREFREFALCGGFPELVGIVEKDIIKKYVRESVVEKIVYRDLQTITGIKDISLVESLFNILMESPGQLVEISGLAKELGVSRQTLSNYLNYLEKAFLVRKLYNFSKSRRKTERKLKKYYPAIVSPDLLFREDELSKSKVFECLVVQQIMPEFFWRDPYKNEVDAVLTADRVTPVEIKYGKIDTKGIEAFMRRFKVREGYIISYSKEQELKINGMRIHFVPAFKFLLQK